MATQGKKEFKRMKRIPGGVIIVVDRKILRVGKEIISNGLVAATSAQRLQLTSLYQKAKW